MSEATQAEGLNPELKKHTFEAEVAQLLHLVTHSLYSNADIFVRELVSNASDACDKLRFEATNDDSLYEDDGELKIRRPPPFNFCVALPSSASRSSSTFPSLL